MHFNLLQTFPCRSIHRTW